ncbi:MAG: excisionase family DNA-binding protein [Dermatophilaceae bacterium]
MNVQSEVAQADAAATALDTGRVVVLPRESKGKPVEVPESVVRVLVEVLDHARRGEAVRVISDDEEITTQETANLLGVSRPYVVGLVDRGDLPSRKVGSRRRLKLSDVLLYREIDRARRLDATKTLAAQAQELGLY